MRKKNIVMFYRKKKPNEANFFDRLGKKSEVYKYYFRRGNQLGFGMYFVSGVEKYLGALRFKNPLFFNGRKFVHKKGIIIADAVFDRSGGVKFPTKEISRKTLNCITFKKICWNKIKTYELIGKYMSRSYAVRSREDLIKNLKKFPKDVLVVLKPARGLGGKGVVIAKRNELERRRIGKKLYLLQKFVDTSRGIPGITKERHDLRVAIAEGKIVLAHVRTPKPGGLLANVAQGGAIRDIPLRKIPEKVLSVVHSVQKVVDGRFEYPLYSIDFGVEKGEPFIFEINDQIGFPMEDMKNSWIFVERILKSLERISEIPYSYDDKKKSYVKNRKK